LKSRCLCGAVYTIKPEFLGKKTICKSCGRTFLSAALPPETSDYWEAPSAGPPEAEPAPRPTEVLLPAEYLLQETEETEPVLEEIEPVEEPFSGPLQLISDPVPPQAEADLPGGRWPVLALTVAALAGTLVGAGLMGLVRQNEIDGLEIRLAAVSLEVDNRDQAQERLETLKQELARVQEEISLLERTGYPAGSIPKTLAESAILEYKTAEALLRQQAAALESGAGLTVTPRGTSPDPELAAAVEGEMTKLQGRLGALRLEAEGLVDEPWSLIQTAIATEELNLAILNRNRLIARYGLSAPLPPRGPAPADDGRQPPPKPLH
jgi:hypothetical protein